MSRLSRTLGIGITIISVAYFAILVYRNSEELQTIEWNPGLISGILGAAVIYVGGLALGGIAWHLLLRASGGSPGLAKSYTILSLSQIAKYLPGNFGHHLGRITLAKDSGIPISRTVLTIGYEAGWQILASALLGIGWLVSSGDQPALTSVVAPQVWLIVVFGIAGLIAPPSAGWLLSRWRPKFRGAEMWSESTQLPGTTTLLTVLLLYGVAFLIVGGIIGLLLVAFYNVETTNLLYHTGLFSLAWVVGFVTPGAPAGLGIRDAILVTGLSVTYGAGIAVGLTILLRLVTIGGDALAFASGILMRRITSLRSACKL